MPPDIHGGIWHDRKDAVEGGGKRGEMKKRKKMSRAEIRQYGLF